MAKGEAEPLMSPAEMKPLLMLSKKHPVNCAIGMTRDKMGVILLDKKAKPRKMLALMKKKAAAAGLELDMASCRFGQAMVDTETDSRLVQFVVNKETSGAMRPKLLEQLKKAGFGKCEVRIDEALEAEEDEPDDDAEADAAPRAAMPGAEPPKAETEAEIGDEIGAESGAEATAAPPDEAAALTTRLTDLVKRMMAALGANPAGADAMKTAAMAGQAAIKSGDLAAATAAATTLERLLDAVPPGGSAPGVGRHGPGSPVFTKARATWVATRKKVESDLDRLHDAMQAAYKGHPVGADLERIFRSKVEPMLEQLDEKLADKLDEVAQTTDPAAHAKLVVEARQIIGKYESYLSSEPLIAKLDDNPFVPLSMEKTLTASLAALSKAVA